MKKETSVATGRRYESFAACYLEQRDCRITERNFRCKAGEIDLIAIDPAHKLVFVEVRFRASDRFGGALSSVTPPTSRGAFVTQPVIICSPTHSTERTIAVSM